MNSVQEAHAKQAIKDTWQGLHNVKALAIAAPMVFHAIGEAMGKLSTILEFDFDEVSDEHAAKP